MNAVPASDFIEAVESKRDTKRCARCKRPHHNEGWYCDDCIAGTTEKDRFEIGLKKCVDTRPRPRAAAERGQIVETVSTGTPIRYSCGDCGREFEKSHGLDVHLRRAHGIRGAASSAARGIAHREKIGGYQPTTNPDAVNPPQGKSPAEDPPDTRQTADAEPVLGILAESADHRMELIHTLARLGMLLIATEHESDAADALGRILELAS